MEGNFIEKIVAPNSSYIGIEDFLKELRLIEGRGTELPTIYYAMKANWSPALSFDTNESSTHFLAILPAYTIETDQASNQVSNQARSRAAAIVES